MPGSQIAGKPETLEWVKNNNIKTVLDVGSGMGTYSILLKDLLLDRIDSVEIWEPYIEQFDLRSKYSNVYNTDIREFENFDYDLVIFGDVLEHMTKSEAIDVWEKARASAKHAIISIPIVFMPQDGHDHGNPYETHVKDDWTAKEVLDAFPGISEYSLYPEIGVFYAIFKL